MSLLSALKDDFLRHRESDGLRALPALATYRFGVWARQQPYPVRKVSGALYTVALLVSESVSGVYLERQTRVGEALHFVHAGGINIHPKSRLGHRVGVMQGVTLGADEKGAPTIGDDVFLGANATVLGNVTVGDRATVAANSLVLADVPPDHLAIGVPAKVVPKLKKKSRKTTSAKG